MLSLLLVTLLASSHISALTVGASDFYGPEISLKAICEGKSMQIPTIEQVAQLDDQVDHSSSECPLEVLEAVIDLAGLVEETSANVCSETNSRLIAKFANDHLGNDLLPKPIEWFGLSYAMRASQGCKINAAILFADTDDLLAPEDLAQVSQWTRRGGQIDHLLSGIATSGILISPMKLAKVLMDDSRAKRELVMNSALDEDITKIKMVCGRRLRPIYGPLVKPIDNFLQAGFDYPDQLVQSELNFNATQMEKIGTWSRIVYLCEIVDLMASKARADSAPAQPTGIGSGIMMAELSPLPEDQLEELIKRLKARRSVSERLSKEQLKRKLWSSAQSQMDPEEARWFESCMNGTPAGCFKSSNEHKSGS